MKLIIRILLIIGSLLCVGCAAQRKSERSFEYKDMMDALKLVEGKDYILLDVRTVEEFKEGHIPKAINIPLSDIKENKFGELKDKDALILVYCRSGNRSSQAVKHLQDNGFTNVNNIGGVMDYKGELVK